jgi:hypothetical protein
MDCMRTVKKEMDGLDIIEEQFLFVYRSWDKLYLI